MATKLRPGNNAPSLTLRFLEKQIQKTLQDREQDTPQDTTLDITTDKQETNLVNGIQDLMLESKSDVQNLTDIPAPPPDMPEVKSKGEDGTSRPTMAPMYEITDQEIQLQKEEEKYGIYMSTFGYEGDDSNLDSETESDSSVTAYPYLG